MPLPTKMDGRSTLRARHSTNGDGPQVKRSRRSQAPSGADTASDEGADRCQFSCPTAVEPDARATQRLVEAPSEPVDSTQLTETSGTAEHLSGIMAADTNPPC